jgi:hypothetical protein
MALSLPLCRCTSRDTMVQIWITRRFFATRMRHRSWYVCILTQNSNFSFSFEINVLQDRYIETMREKQGPDVNWMIADFDTVAAYATDGGVRHGRYFVLSIHFILIIVILPYCIYYNTLCRFHIGDCVVDRQSYSRQSSSSMGTRRPHVIISTG